MRALKLTTVATAALAALAGISAASAADLAARPYTKAPVYIEPIYNWTGFYIGGNGGYSWGRSHTSASFFNPITGAAIVLPAGSIVNNGFNMDGGVAGGQVGYNWQTSNWVLGLEADAQWSGERGSAAYRCAATAVGGVCLPGLTFLPAGATGTNLAVSQSLEWFGTVRGRAGIAATPKVLLYATGGLAYGSIKTSAALAGLTPAGGALAAAGSNTETRVGWTVGAGVEGAIAGNWTAKLEYLYMDLGRYNSGTISLAPGAPIAASLSSHFTDHILRAGINYRFGGPVVAKY